MKPTSTIIILLTLAGTISLTGCNKGKIPGLVQCEGTVTWKGNPVEGARVAFIPQGSSGRSAFGLTDAAGRFKVTTLDSNDGIIPGEYIVTVTKRTASRGGSPPPEENVDPDASREGRNAPKLVPEQITETYFIPQVYADRKTSGLSATISPKGNKGLLFELVGEIQNTPTRNR